VLERSGEKIVNGNKILVHIFGRYKVGSSIPRYSIAISIVFSLSQSSIEMKTRFEEVLARSQKLSTQLGLETDSTIFAPTLRRGVSNHLSYVLLI